MRQLQSRFLRNPFWLVPVALAVLGVLAYALQAPWLGYYLDDWIILNAYSTGGAARLAEYAYLGNRPLVWWLWWIGFQVCGSSALGWQLWALAWRWVASVLAWVMLRRLFAGRELLAACAALLFMVYPIFLQQATALTFSFHWICYSLYFLSLWWMIEGVRRGRAGWGWAAAALLANALQLFSQEFYVGLELARPVVVWIALNHSTAASWRKRLLDTLKAWSPYGALFVVYLIWRLLLMPKPGTDRNTPEVLYNLLTKPLSTLPDFLAMTARDVIYGLAGVWARALDPATMVVKPISSLAAWAVGGAAMLAAAFVFYWLYREEKARGMKPAAWNVAALALGAAIVLGGFAPGWSIGRSITLTTGLYNDRFGMAAMVGASLLLAALFEGALRKRSYALVVVCALLGLATAFQFRNTSEYRWSWEKQNQFYWQLKWRAPEIEPGTTLAGNGALARYVGSWANTSALNQMYAPTASGDSSYWYLDAYKDGVLQRENSTEPFKGSSNYLKFNGERANLIAFQFSPEENQCLWVLSETEKRNPFVEEHLRDAQMHSNLSRILPEGEAGLTPGLFLAEPPHGWCYWYQKGSLALQVGDYTTALEAWRAAEAAGLQPGSTPEFMPFIESAARLGDWNLALALTDRAAYPEHLMHDYLCSAWKRFASDAPADVIEQLNQARDCRDFLE